MIPVIIILETFIGHRYYYHLSYHFLSLNSAGILSNTYSTRTSILLNVTDKKYWKKEAGVIFVQCETTVGELHVALFKSNPLFTEVSLCSSCGQRFEIPLYSIAVEISKIQSDLNKSIAEICQVRSRPCDNACAGDQHTDISLCGKFNILINKNVSK